MNKALLGLIMAVFITTASGVVRPALGAVEIYGDVALYPAPELPPPDEVMALSRRLFEADRYQEAVETLRWVAEGDFPEAAEALLLMGRALYSDGYAKSARLRFEDLVLRFPDSDAVRSGRLARRLSTAATWLLEDGEWGEAGRYVDLLRSIDHERTARLALGLEKRVDAALAEYQPLLLRHGYDTADKLRDWLGKQEDAGCNIIKGCAESDESCRGWIGRLAEKSVRRKNEEEQRVWTQQKAELYDELCLDFARRAVEDAQRFELLRQLITTGIVRQAILPSELPWPTNPHRYVVRVTDFTKTTGTWALEKVPWKSYKVCSEIDRDYARRLSFPVLRFGEVSRDLVLKRLGELMRGPEEDQRVRRRKL